MNIYEKIKHIMDKVQYLSKDDNVKFGTTNYKAISEEKVTALMHEQMANHNLVVYPIEMEHHREGTLTHVDVKYRIVNVDKPEEYIDVVSCGDGADTQDKGSGKAMTYAYKYMWLRTFAIPTGDDPDKICNEELEAKQASESAKKAKKDAQAKQAAEPANTAEKAETKPKTEQRCERCGKVIGAFINPANNKEISADEVIKISKQRFNGANYCAECQTAIRKNANGNH